MRIAYFCFIAAAIAALCGMSLGFYMGMVRDFTLTVVHAHINLLGWVTLALYGLYHRGVRRAGNALAWVQVALAAAAVPVMTGGLAGYILTHVEAFIPAVFAGSGLALAGMALFLTVLIADLRPGTARRPAFAASTA